MFTPGTLLDGQYQIRNVLGTGGFGVVYLAYDLAHHRLCALKMPRAGMAGDPAKRDRFLQEAQIWIELETHPLLVQAYGVGEHEGQPYICMEYVGPNEDGINSVSDYLRKGPVPLEYSLNWAVQFCDAMAYAYAHGIRSHRDIKPANLMVGRNRELKITDFGLASRRAAQGLLHSGDGLSALPSALEGFYGSTGRGIGFGTPTHMPPEQFDDAAGCDWRADIYSFGIVLYQLMSRGHLPFNAPYPKAKNASAWMEYWRAMQELHKTAAVPFLGMKLDPIIQKCTRKNPADRYTDLRSLRQDLTGLINAARLTLVDPYSKSNYSIQEVHNKGLSLQHLNKHSDALACFTRVLQAQPQSLSAWSNKAVSLSKLGRYQEAADSFRRALDIDNANPRIWENYAKCMLAENQVQEAYTAISRSIEIDPNTSSAWNTFGRVLSRLKNPDEALAQLNRSLQIAPQSSRALHNMALLLHNGGQHQRALECITKYLERDARSESSWTLRGILEGRCGRYADALACFDHALRIDKQYTLALANKSTLLIQQNDLERARHLIDSDHNIAQHPRGRYNLGIIALKLRHFEEAFSLLDSVVRERPEDTDAACAWAYAIARLDPSTPLPSLPALSFTHAEAYVTLASIQQAHGVAAAGDAPDWQQQTSGLAQQVFMYNRAVLRALSGYAQDAYDMLTHLSHPFDSSKEYWLLLGALAHQLARETDSARYLTRAARTSDAKAVHAVYKAAANDSACSPCAESYHVSTVGLPRALSNPRFPVESLIVFAPGSRWYA